MSRLLPDPPGETRAGRYSVTRCVRLRSPPLRPDRASTCDLPSGNQSSGPCPARCGRGPMSRTPPVGRGRAAARSQSRSSVVHTRTTTVASSPSPALVSKDDSSFFRGRKCTRRTTPCDVFLMWSPTGEGRASFLLIALLLLQQRLER